jgi:hypothetical protein
MNERIEELGRQADEYVDKFFGDDDVGGEEYNIKYTEVFAELLIKECLKVVKDKVLGKYYFSHDDTNIVRDETSLDIYQDIKHYFGVE